MNVQTHTQEGVARDMNEASDILITMGADTTQPPLLLCAVLLFVLGLFSRLVKDHRDRELQAAYIGVVASDVGFNSARDDANDASLGFTCGRRFSRRSDRNVKIDKIQGSSIWPDNTFVGVHIQSATRRGYERMRSLCILHGLRNLSQAISNKVIKRHENKSV